MVNKELYNVNVAIEDFFSTHFDAEDVYCERGKIFREKNLYKSDDDAAYITLFAEERRIMLRVGVLYFTFVVKTGNLDVFDGEYEVTFNGTKGIVTITHQMVNQHSEE